MQSACMQKDTNLDIPKSLKRFVSEAPNLIEQTPIAPDITGNGILPVVNGFRSRPLHRDLPTLRYVIVLICQVSRHAKISYLNID